MPISLPAIPRREFLRKSITAGLVAAVSPSIFAQNKTDPSAWALLSDTHIAGDRGTVAREVNMAGNLEKVAREVAALSAPPVGALVCGDCAYNTGQQADYASFTSLLEPIRKAGVPVHIALGNHDHRERFWESLQDSKSKDIQLGRQVALIPSEHANWLLLDSLETTLSTPGLLGPEQLKWLASTLDAHASKPALIMVHHNPGSEANLNGLKDTAALYEVIRPRKQVKAYLFGHTHVWNIEQDSSGIHLINLPAAAYVFRKEDPSGWVHARLREDGIKLELRCVDPGHKAHGEVKDLKWRPT